MGDYCWANQHRMTWVLDKLPPDVVDDILDALDILATDPTGPCASPMRGTPKHVDRYLAPLPHGYVIVYTVHPEFAFPHRGPTIVIHDFRPIDELS